MTNLEQLGSPRFAHVLSTWRVHAQSRLPAPLRAGRAPLIDWTTRRLMYWYAPHVWTEAQLDTACELASWGARGEWRYTTALLWTTHTAPDLLHLVEIPGVWLCARVF